VSFEGFVDAMVMGSARWPRRAIHGLVDGRPEIDKYFRPLTRLFIPH
jgi:hypothetical protein